MAKDSCRMCEFEISNHLRLFAVCLGRRQRVSSLPWVHPYAAVLDAEVEGDLGHALQVDRIIDLLFAVYVPRFEADNLAKLMTFVQQSFIASADARYHSTFRKLDAALKKYYIVHAVQKGRAEQAIHFFERHGDSFLRSGRGEDWHSWFALPYMTHPSIDFQVYFSKECLDHLLSKFPF